MFIIVIGKFLFYVFNYYYYKQKMRIEFYFCFFIIIELKCEKLIKNYVENNSSKFHELTNYEFSKNIKKK